MNFVIVCKVKDLLTELKKLEDIKKWSSRYLTYQTTSRFRLLAITN